jgi:hypothetical protein
MALNLLQLHTETSGHATASYCMPRAARALRLVRQVLEILPPRRETAGIHIFYLKLIFSACYVNIKDPVFLSTPPNDYQRCAVMSGQGVLAEGW